MSLLKDFPLSSPLFLKSSWKKKKKKEKRDHVATLGVHEWPLAGQSSHNKEPR